GEIEQQVLRLVERISAAAVLIYRPRELHFVPPCSIARERDRTLVPVHPPHVKGSRPFGIVEALQRLPGISPDRLKRLRTAPRYIGEQRAAVILHDVDLA